MTSFPGSPRLMKGAIVGIDPFNPLASVIVFQYNPETLTRTLQAQMAGGQGADRSEALRLKGAPVENITVNIEIDATDQLEQGDALATSLGIYPQLSALEMLIYPKSALVIANTILLAIGTIEVIPPSAPLTLFIWGPKRVLPVKLTQFSITEEAYDVSLNPIRAKVTLGLQVLSYNDLPLTHPGYGIFLAHQVIKETMATLNTVASVPSLSGSFSFSASASVGG
jgi:hypothetical protein